MIADPLAPTAVATLIATGVDPDEHVSEMLPDLRPNLLYGLDLLMTTVNTWRRCVTAHMIADGRMGQDFTFDGKPYRFENERRGEFEGLPELFHLLNAMGMSVSDLGRAASGARVTDLEAAASRLPEDVRQDALDSIRDHRKYKEGSPKLVALDNPYRKARK